VTNVAELLERALVGYTPATGAVSSVTSALVTGTALTPGSKGGKSLIRVDIDGLTGALLTVPASFAVALPPLPTGNHDVQVKLIDPTTLVATLFSDSTVAFA
jgi:hypothetical protein